MTDEFSYSPHTFPFNPDHYRWPQVGVFYDDGATELHIHCIRNHNGSEFVLMGFIDLDREEQISQVIHLAQHIDAEVIMFKGVGFNDAIIGGLMSHMVELQPD